MDGYPGEHAKKGRENKKEERREEIVFTLLFVVVVVEVSLYLFHLPTRIFVV